jgi:hypothetical protein
MTAHDEPFMAQNIDEQLELPNLQVDEQHMTPNEQVAYHLHTLYNAKAQEEQQRAQRVYARLKAVTVEDMFPLPEGQAHLLSLPQQDADLVVETPKRRGRPVARWVQTIAALLVAALLVGGFLATLSLVRQQKNGATASWQVMTSANTDANFQTLTSVAVLSKQDVWAIGESGISAPADIPVYTPTRITSLIEHWNGQQWSVIPGPQLKAQVLLKSITAVSSQDIWAVGGAGNVDAGRVSTHTMLSTLVEHWDGRQWSVVASPSPGKTANGLISVKALSANNIWAVGYSEDKANAGVARTLVEHWNGQRWSVVASPNSGSYAILESVSILSSNNMWSVGAADGHTLIEHWNGQRWSIVDSPSPGKVQNDLSGVLALSATDVWATGMFSNNGDVGTYTSKTLIEHWDGRQWSVAASPNPGSSTNYLLGLTATNENDIWAVGYYEDNYMDKHTGYRALIEHWDGQQWNSGSALKLRPGETDQQLFGITSDPQSHQIWVVGATGTYKTQTPSTRTLIATLPTGR